MIRRLFVLFIFVFSITFVVGSGGYTAVQADRNVNIVVADDERAYLGLAAHNSPNGAFADDKGAELELRLDGTGPVSGAGVNPNAVTHIDNIFNISNQGTQPVTVWINDSSSALRFHTHDRASGRLEQDGIIVKTGESVQVGLVIDATEVSRNEKIANNIVVRSTAAETS